MKNVFISLMLTLTLASNWLTYIEQHEGLRLTAYTINGNRTIGYGHLLKAKDNFTQISQQQADSLLIEDYLKALSYISKRYPSLSDSKKQALAHYVFARGVGNFEKSELAATLKMHYTDEQLFKSWIKAAYIGDKLNTDILYNRVNEYVNFMNENEKD